LTGVAVRGSTRAIRPHPVVLPPATLVKQREPVLARNDVGDGPPYWNMALPFLLEMTRMRKFVLLLVALGLWVGLSQGSARAIPPFKKEFDAKYVKADSTEEADKALAKAVDKVKCNTCHLGKDKKKRNTYGEQLAELLDKKEDAKNKEKIQKALETVSALKIDPEKDDSPTFGDLLKAGKLPLTEDEAKAAAETEEEEEEEGAE
jgi:hypothetical protein